MRPEQDKIAAWLAEHAPQLEEAYRGAVALLDDPRFPGRVRFICHAGRDLCNIFPQAVTGKTELGRANVTEVLDELSQLWSLNGLDNPPATQVSGTEEQDRTSADNRAVPILVFKTIGEVLERHRQGKRNAESRVTNMIEAIAPENVGRQDVQKPLARQWVTLTRWFQGHAHAGVAANPVSEDELKSNFQTLETYLATVIGTYEGEFYKSMKVLDEIIRDTNA